MKTYYIDPLTGKTADNESELKKTRNRNLPIEGLITFIIEMDNDLSVECIKDPDTKEIYINAIGKKCKEYDTNRLIGIIPSPLKHFVSKGNIIDKNDKEVSTLSIILKNYFLVPMLDYTELGIRIAKDINE